jgi:uncharacterized membrane protein
MMGKGNRFHREQAGAVGTMIIVWLVMVAVIGVVVIDAGSITLTKFGLSGVADNAATQAANAFQTTPNVELACQAAVASITADDPTVKLANKGCIVNQQTGVVTIIVKKIAKTIIAGRIEFTKHFTKVMATASNGPSTL